MNNPLCTQKEAEQDPLISVIVPVYNVEKYLPRCLESIERQTYQNLDIILVDDGSTDQSGALCDAFAQRDVRARVIHQANEGLWSARNAGQRAAKGEFLFFPDADDYFHVDIIRLMYDAICKDGGYDFAVVGLIINHTVFQAYRWTPSEFLTVTVNYYDLRITEKISVIALQYDRITVAAGINRIF